MALVGDLKFIFEDYYQGEIDEAGLIEKLAAVPVVYSRPAPSATKVEILPYVLVAMTGASRRAPACA